jgi:phage shock protein E
MARRHPLRLVLTVLFAIAALGATSCADEAASSASIGAGTTVPAPYVLIDVRTAEEFAQGHLDGAQLMSVEAADFDARIATLDENAKVLVYCRSGNRANIAIAKMRDAGFTDLTNLGSVAQAADATGRAVIR